MKSLEEFKRIHAEGNPNLRLGQLFCNLYIKGSWPELYGANYEKAEKLIAQWLKDFMYEEELPPHVARSVR